MSRRGAQAGRKPWTPMRQGVLNPAYVSTVYGVTIPEGRRSIRIDQAQPDAKRGHERMLVEVWSNDLYEATAEHFGNGWAYLTLKRHDRRAVRDWRHLQSIKNEVCGPEREAFEIFPAESRLVDEANQYHLWVMPEGATLPVGQRERQVGGAEGTQGRVRGEDRARQRPFQPGLSTGPAS